MMASGGGGAGDAGEEKGRTQRIMDAMPSSSQAMGAGGSSTYQVLVSIYKVPFRGAVGLKSHQVE